MSRYFLHKNTGHIYRLITPRAFLRHSQELMVIYQETESRVIWVRPKSEFFDGRFKYLGKHRNTPVSHKQIIKVQ